MRTRNTLLGLCLAAVMLAGAGGLALDEATRDRFGLRAPTYRPALETPRPVGEALYLPQVHAVADFDVAGDQLYLLDPLAPAVHRVGLSFDGATHLGSFGRRGGGPGEFSSPTGIAVLAAPPRLAVIEPGRIHTFTLEGEYLSSIAPDLPCLMARPRLGGGRRGMYVHGDCLRRGIGTDTMVAMLFWSPDGERYDELVAESRFTLDGRWGNPFGASVAWAEGPADVHVFGGGTWQCLTEVVEDAEPPRTVRHCSDAMRPHRLELSRETRASLERMQRRSPVLQRVIRIPDNHPYYTRALVLDGLPAVMRGYSEDSTVLRKFGSATDLAVLPITDMLGCRRGVCVGIEARTAGTRLRLYRLDGGALAINAATGR